VLFRSPDLASLGDPALIALQWAAELHLTPEEQLQQFLEYLEATLARGAKAPNATTANLFVQPGAQAAQ
jgi:hypothetical protein